MAVTPVASAVAAFARQPEHDVLPLFVNRWSPRAFRPDPVPKSTLDSMVEAARWAPSSMNLQPWRFFLTTTGATRDLWNSAVGERNRTWSDQAGALVWVVVKTTLGPNPYQPAETPNRHAWFDTGAAAIQFILEGERHGVKSHAMGGIDAAKAHALLGLQPDEQVVCAIAVGHPAAPASLPEGLRQRESPSGRKPGAEIATFA
jgi:nitroreductase